MHSPPEGTWPNTWDWIRDSFAQVPEGEARLILGGNAVRCFGLDKRRLADIAREIGPMPDQIWGLDHRVDVRKIQHFDLRGGYLRGVDEVNGAQLTAQFERDILGVGPPQDAGQSLRR